jgi:hypothetical protein
LKKQFDQIFPSKSYKKTSLFGLFYDINREVEDADEDEYGYPIVEDAFTFSPEEVLIKLFGLRERLKRDYLPLNARIIDITGEGIYFNIYKTRGWIDSLDINEIKSGIEVDFTVYPERGYVEDLRPFYIKPNQSGLLYPNINGVEPGISYYGNTVDPYYNFQEYSVEETQYLLSAVNNFYEDFKKGEMPKFLGDGDYDYQGYKLFSDGSDYVFPAGCPVVIKNNTFNLSWNELGQSWESIDTTIASIPLDVASYTTTTSDNPGTPLQNSYSTDTIELSTQFPNSITINIGTGKDWFNPVANEVIFVRIESVDSPGNLTMGYVSSGGYNTSTGNITVDLIYTRGSGEYSNWSVIPTNINSSVYTFNYFQNYYRQHF